MIEQSTRLQRITHEYPAITVIALDTFDIGIDPSEDDGVNVVVYGGRWADDGPTHAVAFTIPVPLPDGYTLTDADRERTRRTGSPWIASVTASAERVHVTLTNGAALIIDGAHVFGFTENDGGACTAIVHMGAVDPAECYAQGCDTWDRGEIITL